MATSSESAIPSLGSYDTALCVIPPTHMTRDIDRLRALYDKAYGRWPAHVNVLYPFVAVECLPRALEVIQSKLRSTGLESGYQDLHVRLDKSDCFAHKRSNTIYMTEDVSPSNGNSRRNLAQLRKDILQAFNRPDDAYRLHLTIGQSEAHDVPSREYLLDKAGLLPPIEWRVEELVVLVREKVHARGAASSRMRVWGTISLSGDFPITISESLNLQKSPSLESELPQNERDLKDSQLSSSSGHTQPNSTSNPAAAAQPPITFQFSAANSIWNPIQPTALPPDERVTAGSLTVSTYNVSVDAISPPPRDRYPILLQNLLSESALADLLVLQEVSDDFLSYLLNHDDIRNPYPFTTHGQPDPAEIGPLASLWNIVVLSRWRFRWEWPPFEKRHKGALVVVLDTVGTYKDSTFLPLIVAGVHLTCGLTDNSIAAKQSQVKSILRHLSRNYPENQWIVAGAFNIATSRYTIDAAVKGKSISPQSATTLSSLDTMLFETGLCDAWFAARASAGETSSSNRGRLEFESLYEGEEGATFDPTENPLAAEIAGRSYHSRPQRYDRIFVKGDSLRVTNFNMFGFPGGNSDNQSEKPSGRCGSDHWGIRASLELDPNPAAGQSTIHAHLSVPIQVKKAPPDIADVTALKACLDEHHMFPTHEEVSKHKEVFSLVKDLLQQGQSRDAAETRSSLSFVVVPVGSYRLGVWNTSSDIDCLCIGQISPKTFFTIFVPKLRKAAGLGVKVLRKVKAASGTMLQLEVRDVRVDLHYCPATSVVERWPQVLDLPPSDSSLDLPVQSLIKLNCLRDVDYLQRTIPDLAAFRLAYRFIKTWAKQRGIYSSKLGYFGGIHIVLLLSRICKLSFRQTGAITASDLICTFFNHYAHFDWKTEIVFDPFFYKQPPRYYRSAREPIVILGIHPPKVNVAHTVSPSSLKTLDEELKRADRLLSKVGVTWSELVGTATGIDVPSGANEFLKSHNSYVKIDVQYWGMSSARGRMLVGWLESRCVLLLVDINRTFPDIHARIWPARFTKMEDIHENEGEYQGCYLVGLAKGDTASSPRMSESDRRSAHVALQVILNGFAEQIRSDETYFDAASSWVDVTLVKQSDLQDLRIDDRDLGTFFEEESDSEDGDSVATADDIDLVPDDGSEEKSLPMRPSINPRAGNGNSSSSSSNKPAGATRLRPAGDILNRLRWDPSLDSSDYLVGYEDRFTGIREMVIYRWKSEQTDEEFIPQHRIVYFKRKSDGVVVWDRTTRRDDIFGSGDQQTGGQKN
ncbi:hypothetical protein VTN77DRAFT_3477 [Rasamsonia byssochlamydoides]|uniref:uncharacterized protein n=1 Tax=Rasamsonia byssochlamydoides TaxID=89139 RepID=UPI003743B5A7